MSSTKIAGPEASINEVVALMHSRIAAGCDPLSGRPFLVVGAITACDDGKCRDEAGTEVTLSEFGDWVPVEKQVDKLFRFHWRDGKRSEGRGRDAADAFSRLGYGAGAAAALDYYEQVPARITPEDES